MAKLEVIVSLLIVATCVNILGATHDYCESYPACPGRCRDSCLPGEEASSTSIENWGCQNSFYTVDYCCKGKGELPSTDIETSSSSTNLPNHPAWKAFDGSLSTAWQPIPNAALPQWVKVTLKTTVCLLEATITRGANRNIKKFQLIYDTGSSPVFAWPKSEGVTKTLSLAGMATKTIKIVILEKFHPGAIMIKEFGNLVALTTP